MQLTTERLILREYEESDGPAVLAWVSHSEAVRYRPVETRTEEEARAFVKYARGLAQEQPRKGYELAVATRSDGCVMGGWSCTFMTWNIRREIWVSASVRATGDRGT